MRLAENSQSAYQNDTTVENLALKNYFHPPPPPGLKEAFASFTRNLHNTIG
jgi:hypothetical protein